ncbi:unnamed protein product, partial [Adineta steineri]
TTTKTTTSTSTTSSSTTSKTTTSTSATTATTTLPPFPLSGFTVAGHSNCTAGNDSYGLANPYGLALGIDGSLFIADHSNSRVVQLKPNATSFITVAGNGVAGGGHNQLMYPGQIILDASMNMYINDDQNSRVMFWKNNATTGSIVAGNGTYGTTTNTLGNGIGLAVDLKGNIYAADNSNSRVMKWAPNATVGTVFIGSTQINQPYGLFLDENNTYIYVTDYGNNRIQRYHLSNATVGTTVAAGYGSGTNSSQLNQPYAACVSRAGDIYIADKLNHRVQLWRAGATTGITIIGVTGVTGTNATMLHGPAQVMLSPDESFL